MALYENLESLWECLITSGALAALVAKWKFGKKCLSLWDEYKLEKERKQKEEEAKAEERMKTYIKETVEAFINKKEQPIIVES